MPRYLTIVLLLVGCERGTRKPTGTTSDPVEVCERVGDVCRIDRAKLGVCAQRSRSDDLTCMPQH